VVPVYGARAMGDLSSSEILSRWESPLVHLLNHGWPMNMGTRELLGFGQCPEGEAKGPTVVMRARLLNHQAGVEGSDPN
jgi:hypothetical protein